MSGSNYEQESRSVVERTDDGVAEQIRVLQDELANTINKLIPEYQNKVKAGIKAAMVAKATIKELKAKKSLSAAEKRALAEAEKVQADFKALNDTLNALKSNVVNIERQIENLYDN